MATLVTVPIAVTDHVNSNADAVQKRRRGIHGRITPHEPAWRRQWAESRQVEVPQPSCGSEPTCPRSRFLVGAIAVLR
jgi:hypothetical protein